MDRVYGGPHPAARGNGARRGASPLAIDACGGVVSGMNSGPASTRARARLWGGLALSMTGLAAIAWLTLRPNPASLVVGPAPCCAATDLLFNVLLYLPLGAGLALLGIRPRSAVAVGGLLSAGIELAQRAWVPGRFASPYDVATNLAGCALGVLIVASWDRRAAWWPFLAPPLAVTVVLGWFLGGYLAQPAIPGPAPWRAEWAPESPGMAAFRGQILDVRLQGTPIGAGPVANLSVLRARLAASRKVDFSATLVTGVASEKRSRLLEVVVGEGTVPFLVLDQEGGTLLAYQRTGLSWVGLRGPWLELEDALPLAAGDTVRVQLEATRRHLKLTVTGGSGGAMGESSLRLAPELYFGALLYRATDGAIWWNLLPAVASFVLLGLALAGRPRLLAVVGLASLFLSAVGGGCALPAWPVALLAIAGAAAGRAAAMRLGMFGGLNGSPSRPVSSDDRSGYPDYPREAQPGGPPPQVRPESRHPARPVADMERSHERLARLARAGHGRALRRPAGSPRSTCFARGEWRGRRRGAQT